MTDPLRVLLLTAKLSPAAGGLAISVPGLAHGLDTFDDIEAHVMGTLDEADPRAAQAWGSRVHAYPPLGPRALQFTPHMVPALTRLAPDVIDVQGLWTWASKASLTHFRRYRHPYVVTPRGMLDPWARQNSAWKKRLFATFFETAHLRDAGCIRATSEMEASHLREMGIANPIAIVANGIDLPSILPRQNQSMRTILFLSRIHPKKGITYLIEAWRALSEDFGNWRLVIAGIDENGYEKELMRIVERKNIPRVEFFGPVYGIAKQQLYRNADLFVLPTHAENFGLVVAEALAQETPVITTTNAPWEGLHTYECGWWINLDQHSLNASLRGALLQPNEVLRTMGARGRQWVCHEFGMDKVARRMRDVYLWLAGRSDRPPVVYG